jgi:hypothetical protein
MIHSKNWCGAKLVKYTTQKTFSDRIKIFIEHWNRCIEVDRDYIER